MSRYIAFLFAFVCIRCADKPLTTAESSSGPASNYSKLDTLFEGITSDSLFVFSTETSDDSRYRFVGTRMDSAEITALGLDFTEGWNREMYACCKLPLAKSVIGLIVRGIGEYDVSKLKLFVFDTEKDAVVNVLDLADTFGDAGEFFSSCSYIFEEKNKILMLNYYEGSYDHSVENLSDTIVEYWYRYYLYDLSKVPVDTLSKDSATIILKYPGIIKRMAGA